MNPSPISRPSGAEPRHHRDFLTELDFTRDEVIETLALARELKELPDRPDAVALQHQTWGMIFHKPSLRTRISFEVALNQLGGRGIYITDNEIQLGKRETIADAARVLSRYLNGIIIRTFSQTDVEELAKYADIPVINALTDLLHPCQIMSDILTIYEKLGRYENFKLVYIGDGNNITNSFLNLSTLLGIELVVATSPDTLPDMQVFERAQKAGSSRVVISHEPDEAVRGAHVIYTDVWASMGQKDQFMAKEQALRAFQVNKELVKKADKDCIVMHCLPAERGREITDEMMDGPHSVVFDQAENRLHMQKAIILKLLEG
ncbi:ornithine carbamoyltransferase [candidate division KSB1 bacterium]|nr:MAG: ornithine carbamoyltransferase [candidate division KSB1 bacterium]